MQIRGTLRKDEIGTLKVVPDSLLSKQNWSLIESSIEILHHHSSRDCRNYLDAIVETTRIKIFSDN